MGTPEYRSYYRHYRARKTSFGGHPKDSFMGKFFLRNLKGMTYLHIC